MALTQISTAGVKDDAVTAGKIPANAVGSSELADNAVDTAAIQDDAVTDAKLANSINSAIAANTAKVQTTINNNADNRVITGSGTANTLEGEANLTFSGGATGDALLNIHAQENANTSEAILKLETSNDFAESVVQAYDSSGIGGSLKYNHGDNAWRFTTNGDNERMRIDSSGFVGIGESSPSSYDSGARTLVISQGGTLAGMTIRASQQGAIYFADGTSSNESYRGRIEYIHADDALRFGTAATERMRIDSAGRLLLGTTTYPDGSADGIGLLASNGERAFSRGNTGTRYQITFYNPNGLVGRIETSGSATSYITSSDYRLKENTTAIADGITRLKTLKPYRFNFKADPTTTVDGFLAHEVTTVPEAISGTKDEIDSDNNPVYQGIDQSKLVPLLTAALQEAIAKIETLETKVAALEAA